MYFSESNTFNPEGSWGFCPRGVLFSLIAVNDSDGLLEAHLLGTGSGYLVYAFKYRGDLPSKRYSLSVKPLNSSPPWPIIMGWTQIRAILEFHENLII
jgi:hypothetical protein